MTIHLEQTKVNLHRFQIPFGYFRQKSKFRRMILVYLNMAQEHRIRNTCELCHSEIDFTDTRSHWRFAIE